MSSVTDSWQDSRTQNTLLGVGVVGLAETTKPGLTVAEISASSVAPWVGHRRNPSTYASRTGRVWPRSCAWGGKTMNPCSTGMWLRAWPTSRRTVGTGLQSCFIELQSEIPKYARVVRIRRSSWKLACCHWWFPSSSVVHWSAALKFALFGSWSTTRR